MRMVHYRFDCKLANLIEGGVMQQFRERLPGATLVAGGTNINCFSIRNGMREVTTIAQSKQLEFSRSSRQRLHLVV